MKKATFSLPALWGFVLALLSLLSVNNACADRSLRQQDPAYMYEKAGEYAKAALYWHRAARGVSEVWIPFMWGDVSNAPPRFEESYRNLVPEYQARVKKCLRLGKVDQAQRAYIEFINEIWMNELVEQEDGGFRASSGLRAEEAEKYGDFLLDFTKPIQLKPGLHDIRLEFHTRSYDDANSISDSGIWAGTPCLRLYWSSEHFLRELVSAEHLIHFAKE